MLAWKTGRDGASKTFGQLVSFPLANLPTQITKQSPSESWMKIRKNVTVSSTLPWSSFHLPDVGISLNHASTMSLGSEKGRLLTHDLMVWLIQVKVYLFLFYFLARVVCLTVYIIVGKG